MVIRTSFTDINDELYLFGRGELYESYKLFGAHYLKQGEQSGVLFTVWAPNAQSVAVAGSFNHWSTNKHQLNRISEGGVWQLFCTDANVGDSYKYSIKTASGEYLMKSDPYALWTELRPETASIVYDLSEMLNFNWTDETWREQQKKYKAHSSPVNIYEMHVGSWKRHDVETSYTWLELAEELPVYLQEMGYTHVELLPIMEHPFDGSWGYQITGFFSVTSRYGTPKDFLAFVNACHNNGIGVLLDWVPGHFCKDDHGLRLFDGMPLYEYSDSVKAEKSEWGTLSFDFGRNEVKSFLISNAMYWFEVFHIDGLRVDAVASMLYLDFGKEANSWTPNQYGGRENIEAIEFIRQLNQTVFAKYPYALMMAEESTSWPMVSAPVYLGGLGFNFKWNMGWMNDTLKYMEMDPIHRKWHHNLLTFSFFYAFSENFILPLSHDEVVHGKKSIVNKMPGDYWKQFANTRALYGYKMTHPGKKLLFMGSEFAQYIEWDEKQSLDWLLLEYPKHKEMQLYVKDLNNFYKENAILWQLDHEQAGFEWIDADNYEQSVIVYMRKDKAGDFLIVVSNFTPNVHEEYQIGVPYKGTYQEVFSSDKYCYGGSNVINEGVLETTDKSWQSQKYSLKMRVPPLATVILAPVKITKEEKKDAKKTVCSDVTSRRRR